MDLVRILASCALLAMVLANDNNKTTRSGMLGRSVKLSCDIPRSDPPKVKWYDTVHSVTPDPILIFSSEDDLSDSHPNKADFKVDRKNFDLRISNLTFDDAGEYFCESEKDSITSKKSYSLTVHRPINCSGNTNLNEGQSTNLLCFVFSSGDLPPMKWFQGDREVNSNVTDLSGIDEKEDMFVVRKDVHLRATHELDGQTLRCNLDFIDKPEDCRLVFNITYLARDLMFSSKGDTLYVGESLSCTARGNPEPTIVLLPTSVPEVADKRRKSQIIIPKPWEGRNVTFECTAVNTVGGESKPLKESRSYRVVAATTTTTTTTTPKPNHPVNHSGNGGENSFGARFATWILLLFASISFTLTQLHGVRCC